MSAAHPLPHPYAGRVQAPARPARHPGALRVTGSLTAPAELRPTTEVPMRLLLCVQLQPARGLPYVARVDLGTNPGDHLAADALLPHLRTGAVLSVAAEAMELRSDHDRQVLRLVQPHSVLLLEHPIEQVERVAEPDLFSTPDPAQAVAA
jgi:hypothetical protein